MSISRSRCAVLLATLTGVAGCSDPPANKGGGRPPGEATFVPAIEIRAALVDGTTNAGQGPFTVSYHGRATPIDDVTLGRLAGRLSLRTWPEGEVIAAVTTAGLIPETGALPGARGLMAQIAPAALLEDRWYSLQFGPVEQGLESQQSFDGGVWGIRLRPGSHPTVRSISFCEAADIPGAKLIVWFSEAVVSPNPAEMFTLTRQGQPLTCRFDALGRQDLHELCSTLVPGPVTVTLATDSAQGAGGTPLPAGNWDLDTTTLPPVETGCVGLTLPL